MQTEMITVSKSPNLLSGVNISLAKVKSNGVQTSGSSGTGTKIETDPTGRDSKQGGAKLDAGKPCVWRGVIDYFPAAIRAVATVSTFGASKYSWKGWSTVPEGFERYSDAMVRHLVSESDEGPYDNDSGLLHAAHVAWGALARLEFLLHEKNLCNGTN
jgi:hypothetical protein